jgi:hypothetical protein
MSGGVIELITQRKESLEREMAEYLATFGPSSRAWMHRPPASTAREQ